MSQYKFICVTYVLQSNIKYSRDKCKTHDMEDMIYRL